MKLHLKLTIIFILSTLTLLFTANVLALSPSLAIAKTNLTETTTTKTTATSQSQRIDINNASLAELQSIPYIGSKRAQAIADYRTANGEFMSVNELLHVKYISEKLLKKLKPYIIAQTADKKPENESTHNDH